MSRAARLIMKDYVAGEYVPMEDNGRGGMREKERKKKEEKEIVFCLLLFILLVRR